MRSSSVRYSSTSEAVSGGAAAANPHAASAKVTATAARRRYIPLRSIPERSMIVKYAGDEDRDPDADHDGSRRPLAPRVRGRELRLRPAQVRPEGDRLRLGARPLAALQPPAAAREGRVRAEPLGQPVRAARQDALQDHPRRAAGARRLAGARRPERPRGLPAAPLRRGAHRRRRARPPRRGVPRATRPSGSPSTGRSSRPTAGAGRTSTTTSCCAGASSRPSSTSSGRTGSCEL